MDALFTVDEDQSQDGQPNPKSKSKNYVCKRAHGHSGSIA